MDTNIVSAFSRAAKGTFKDMFALTAEDIGASELTGSEDHGWDITGLVGLAGQAQGVVAIRLTNGLLSSLLACTGVASGADETRQLESGLVGEMINIIAAQAISAIHNINIDIAPPVIVRGPNHKIGWPAIAPVIALSFTLPTGSFEVDLCIRH
jgi:chemotaxis protein CheX